MSDSILTSTKKMCGLDESYTVFDLDFITHINSVFSTLGDLGIGPDDGFAIEDKSAVWDDFLANDNRLNSAKTYMYLRVRMLFDPPTTSFLLDATKEQIKELEWRLNVQRESVKYPLPDSPPFTVSGGNANNDPYDIIVWDGGGA